MEDTTMINEDVLNEYGKWIDEATSKAELKDILCDIRDDILSDNDEDEDSGGMTKVLRK